MRPTASSRSGKGRAIVIVGLAAFVLGVYVLVVLGGGALIGRTDSPSPVLSVLATTVVALGFAPVQGELNRTVARHIATPYDVFRRFAENAGDAGRSPGPPSPHVATAHPGHRCAVGAGLAPASRPPDGRRDAGRSTHPMTARHRSPGSPAPQQGRMGCARRPSGTATRCWACSGYRSGRAYRSQRWRSGCSPISHPKRGAC